MQVSDLGSAILKWSNSDRITEACKGVLFKAVAGIGIDGKKVAFVFPGQGCQRVGMGGRILLTTMKRPGGFLKRRIELLGSLCQSYAFRTRGGADPDK